MPDLYRIDAHCHVCGKKFLARYNVGKRAKVCTPPDHKCLSGDKNNRKIGCLDECCRYKYKKASVAQAGSAIDSRKFLVDKEYDKVVDETLELDNPLGLTLRFILETGCRLGESLLIRKNHCEWRSGPLSVVRIPTLKRSGHPALPVHLDNKTEFVRELRAWTKSRDEQDVLFMVARRSLQRAFERILDRVKPERTGLVHLLRHTRASRLTRAGLDPNVIRSEMRWSSIELLKVYAHTDEDQVANALGKLR
jgi:integrase